VKSDKNKLIYLGFLLLLGVLVFWRYGVVTDKLENSKLKQYNDTEEEIILIGKIIKEPDVRETNTKLTIGRILITVGRYPEYKYGDELKITGELQTPVIFDEFNYKNYLLKDGITSVSYYPQIQLIEKGRSPTSTLLKFKERVREGIYENLSAPQSEILGAMILGDKNRMSEELKEKLNMAGIRHITAISGLHIFILSSILMSLLLGIGLWRNQAFYISAITMFLFIAMIGFQSSSVRAGIMGFLFLLAQKLGRQSVSSRLIIITGLIMLVVNPLLLFYDIGFQLSFLAAFGIIYLSPFFRKIFKKLPENLNTILTSTFSAYIFTLPILIYSFGRVSLIGPLTNILVIPIVYLLMVSGLIFALVGLIWPFLAWLLSFPIWLLLTYILKITDIFSGPWAAKTVTNLHWFWLALFYLFLLIVIKSFKSNKYRV